MADRLDRLLQSVQGTKIVRTTLGSCAVARIMGATLHRCAGRVDNRTHSAPERSAVSYAVLVIDLVLAEMVVGVLGETWRRDASRLWLLCCED